MPKISCFWAFSNSFCFSGSFFEKFKPKICFFIHQMRDEISQMTDMCGINYATRGVPQSWTVGSYGPEGSFLLVLSAIDDLVKVSFKSDARKCQNQVTSLTLTSWVKVPSPFSHEVIPILGTPPLAINTCYTSQFQICFPYFHPVCTYQFISINVTHSKKFPTAIAFRGIDNARI